MNMRARSCDAKIFQQHETNVAVGVTCTNKYDYMSKRPLEHV